MRDNSYYLDLFRVTPALLERIIGTARSSGAQYADIYMEYTIFRNLSLRDGQVSSGGTHIDYGTGIRAIHNDHTGYSYCESTEVPDMIAAAKAAACIADGAAAPWPVQENAACDVASIKGAANDFYPCLNDWDKVDSTLLCDTLTELDSRLRCREPRITKILAKVASSDSYILMYNSLGELCCDCRPMGSMVVTAMFSDGKSSDSRSVSRSFRCGSEMICREMTDAMVEELLSGIDPLLEATRPKGGRMPVVMDAGASGILLHEAMGHAFEADFNRKGQSIFSEKMGQRVCPAGINIVDDGTLKGNRGACNMDDEGIAGQKTYMVSDGILTSYLHDRISARHYGVAPTGNGRRESFRFEPLPRMRLTYMESGQTSPSDIIASVSSGIYVDEFTGGQVKIGEGDFTFYVKSGRLIENGRLTRPIKDINVIGNGPRVLQDITAVGNDLRIDDGTWTCGKGQSVAVGCGMPTVLVRELTVGGE